MPASWEINLIRDKRLLLGIIKPSDMVVGYEWGRNLRPLALPPGSDFMDVAGFPFGPARNKIAKTALELGYNLAFLDSDLRVPEDTYLKLSQVGLDMIAGLYFQRQPPYMPLVMDLVKDEKGNLQSALRKGWSPGDLVPCMLIPTGMTYYHRRVLEAMFNRWPRPFEWGVDVAPVPSEDGVCPPHSEDYSFSYRCNLLGIKGAIHTGIVGLHEVRAVVGPRWIVPQPNPDPAYGVCGVIDRTGP